MQLPPLFDFLARLAAHNDRAWFQERKAEYTRLRADFEEDVAFWRQELNRLDPALAGPLGRTSVFRIYRDVRFSKNKDPYKTHFSAYFTASAGKDIDAPGYYVQVGPGGQTLVAAGLHQPDKTQLAAIRQEIDYNAAGLQAVLGAPGFRRHFAGLSGEQLKKAPAGYDPAHPEIELLKFKSFTASQEIPDAEALAQKDFRGYVLARLGALVPLCGFLRDAVG
ncbi:DUF2461 domain-containing protein [Hymenobacter caeli]|uniref:Uncharacterized protein (TIGR02453 family) n=1 Tax=Hymenobacter caeli TaxID=2735894 RepID=A0ABX2FR81_9BACT|nr:DUF2461 domain-containing protein [Hymenobacter caeli]NRT18999.1 uncharacterized protein (TIGR02453 family) [Hymenobacter caeli]